MIKISILFVISIALSISVFAQTESDSKSSFNISNKHEWSIDYFFKHREYHDYWGLTWDDDLKLKAGLEKLYCSEIARTLNKDERILLFDEGTKFLGEYLTSQDKHFKSKSEKNFMLTSKLGTVVPDFIDDNSIIIGLVYGEILNNFPSRNTIGYIINKNTYNSKLLEYYTVYC